MKRVFKKSVAMLLSVLLISSMLLNNVALAVPSIDPTQVPSQIALALTSDPQTSISINWTTVDTTLTDEK